MTILLPHDRQMTPDERRGFRIACACMASWGRQVEHAGLRIGGPPLEPVPQHKVQAHVGRMLRAMAESLDVTLGQHG
jgi:hypothetical protein